LPILSNRAQPKTAFVFAGGGSFGAIQVGMLHALAAHGIVADVVFGSSVGALNGAYYAGIPTIEGIQQLEVIWRGLHRRDVFQVTWRTVLGFVRRRDFLATSQGLRQIIDKHLPYRNLEDAKIPILIVATDILSGETVVLSKGPAAQAILASAAIPPAFAPVQFEGLYLADGAISSNTPVKVARCAWRTTPHHFADRICVCAPTAAAGQLLSELEGLDRQIDYFIVPPLCPLIGSPYDFSQTSQLIARAVESTNAWLPGGGLERPKVHEQLGLHKHSH
jgi:NTE family protein